MFKVQNPKSSRCRLRLAGLLLVVITVAVFWPVKDHRFVWDDRVNVEENPHLRGTTVSQTIDLWKSPYKKLYVPLTYTVWGLLARFSALTGESKPTSRLDPAPFHLANLAVHLLSVIVVFVILLRLVGKDWAAACGALLFAAHPVQVEPVAWVTGMKDVLSGLCSLLAIWQYLLYAGAPCASTQGKAGKGEAFSPYSNDLPHPWKNGLHYLCATVAFVLALLAKPAAVGVPVIAGVMECWLLRRPARRWALPLIVWVVIALPFMALTKWEQPDTKIDWVPSLWARPIVAGDALAFYLYKLVFPLWLGPDYGRSPEFVLRSGWSFVTWVIPLALAGLIWGCRKRRPWLSASTGIFVAGLIPVLGLIPFNFQNFSTVADRYLYLSLLGPALALAWFLAEDRERKRPTIALCALVLGLLGIKSSLQTLYWRDATTLFRHALQVNPNSWTAHYNLGNVLESGNEVEEAIGHYRETLRILPTHAKAHNNLGIALEKRGDLEEAVEHYQSALRIDPALAEAHHNLASVWARRGELDRAILYFREAVRLQPEFAAAHESLGRALALQGKREEAIEHMERAVSILRSRAKEGN